MSENHGNGQPFGPSRAEIESIEDPVARLRVLMKRLLDPGGCPWDRKQTHETLKQYLIEESYEVCDAIDGGNPDELRDELGDVALQVVFHAELAERAGKFKFEDAYASICRKLLDRHPHVFGNVIAEDADTVLKNWEQIKKDEKTRKADAAGSERPSALDGVPAQLPALQRAARIQEKASRVGFDWDAAAPVIEKVKEELGELLEVSGAGAVDAVALKHEFGDLLFSLVNLSRFLDIEAEDALRQACERFRARFAHIERSADSQGKNMREMTLQEMDELWNEAKRL